MGKASSLFHSEAKQTLHSRVTPTPAQRQYLQNAWNDLAEHLKASLNAKYGFPISTWIQGSYKYGTLIRPTHPDEGYDVDVGVYFEWKEDFVAAPTPSQLREWVQSELLAYESSTTEIQSIEIPPKERCSRAIFKQKFHIDTPVYHLNRANDKRRLACLAGGWEESDPKAIYKWFRAAFSEFFSEIDKREQARRAIRYLKGWAAVAFTSAAQSRPSSILITVLVCEELAAEYRSRFRAMDDEVALIAVVRRIHSRLVKNPIVPNPIAKKENLNRIGDDDWDGFLVRLQTLRDAADHAEAAESEAAGALAWSEVFSFLMPLPNVHAIQVVDKDSARPLMRVPDIEILVSHKGGRAEISKHINAVPAVAAGCVLEFSITNPHTLPEFATIEWTVRDCSDDQGMDGALGHRKVGVGLLSTTELTNREGTYSMDCIVRVGGSVYGARRVPFHVGEFTQADIQAVTSLARTDVTRRSLAQT